MKTSKTMAFSIRLSKEDRTSITQAAKFLGCSPSSFIRDAAVMQAEEVLSDPEAFALSRVRRLIREHRRENLGPHASRYDPAMYPDHGTYSPCQCSDCTTEREQEPANYEPSSFDWCQCSYCSTVRGEEG